MPTLPPPTVSSGRLGVRAVALVGAFLIAMLFMVRTSARCTILSGFPISCRSRLADRPR